MIKKEELENNKKMCIVENCFELRYKNSFFCVNHWTSHMENKKYKDGDL